MNPDIRWDHDRESRTGIPEVVFGPGKTLEHLRKLFTEGEGLRLATRLSPEQMDALEKLATVDPVSRTALRAPKAVKDLPPVGIITAGTGDIPVASEARATLEAMGYPARIFFDVGVAGLHRLQAILPDLKACPVLIVCAGMEGALATMVGGLTPAPVVAVPTSVGYGAALEGVTALLAMLSSCAAGITVVGIDNGYGAACAVARLLP